MATTPKHRSPARIPPRVQVWTTFSFMVLMTMIWLFGEGGLQGYRSAALMDSGPIGGGAGIAAAMLLVILMNSLFVAGETAVSMLKPLHIRHMREQNEGRASRLQTLVDGRLTFMAACKLGSDIARLAIMVLALFLAPGLTELGATNFGWERTYITSILLALAIMVPVGILNLVAELVPKSYAGLHPHGVATYLYPFIRATHILFSVPAKLVTFIANVFTMRFGGKASFVMANQTEEEIKTLVETGQASGEIEEDEKELLHSVFDFTDTVAREVMTPRVDMDSMPVNAQPSEVLAVIKETGHSRIPLYAETDDQIVGIVHAKDLLMGMLNGNVPKLDVLMRPVLFVPESKVLHELLAEMRTHRSQMAIVQDEFGGTAGVVTIEDIVEELVGDIVDEYDDEEPEIVAVEGGWIVDGKVHLDDVNDAIGSQFASEEFDTVGGMVFGLFGRQPQLDDHIEYEGYRFTVAVTDGRRIHRLHIAPATERATMAAT